MLLVDEVLAVGDELFQAKCLSRVKRFQDEGRTIVFVTHDARTVRQICTRAIVLDHGDSCSTGRRARPSAACASTSTARTTSGTTVSRRRLRGDRQVVVHHAHEQERRHLRPGEPFEIVVELRPQEPIELPVLDIEIADRRGNLLYGADTDGLGMPLSTTRRAAAGAAAHRTHVAARR